MNAEQRAAMDIVAQVGMLVLAASSARGRIAVLDPDQQRAEKAVEARRVA